jgi:hypothetical protein
LVYEVRKKVGRKNGRNFFFLKNIFMQVGGANKLIKATPATLGKTFLGGYS